MSDVPGFVITMTKKDLLFVAGYESMQDSLTNLARRNPNPNSAPVTPWSGPWWQRAEVVFEVYKDDDTPYNLIRNAFSILLVNLSWQQRAFGSTGPETFQFLYAPQFMDSCYKKLPGNYHCVVTVSDTTILLEVTYIIANNIQLAYTSNLLQRQL